MRFPSLRRTQTRGRSGKLLVAAGQSLLALGLLTDTLGQRIGAGGFSVTLLELGVVVLVVALAVAFLKVVARKVKRTVGISLLSAASLGVGVPALGAALPAVSVGKRVVRRLPLSHLPWFGKSRWERVLAFLGGPRGLATGGVGAVLLTVGAQTGKLGETHVVFGQQLTLLSLFVLLSVPGVVIYGIRRP
ncbi:hypothetical protein [Halospeciosus flavus]|uniref:Uncharacterized protein n=1 Tax=Halospeciosus flavus TaxID=3032283 RepID=A0ABD5Z136_9EURY|nr:hypothetical protein [Halospeciosus flavus]